MRPRNTSKVSDVVAYLRVSTEEQGESGAGLAAQQEAITRDVERRGWVLVETHTDIASGKTRARRPGLADSLDAVHSGRAGTLMVAKLDRLSRSLIDFATIMAEAKDSGWNVVALDLGVDLSTPAGEFLASVMASMAQWERRIISQRTSDALAAIKREGRRLGRPVALDPRTEAMIVALRNDGHSYYSIAKDLNHRRVELPGGGRRWHSASVRAITERVARGA